MKIALAGLAGVGLAWLIPKGGGTPSVQPSVTASDRPGVTAVELQLASIEQGVSFRMIDGVRVFLVRSGDAVLAFHGRSTEEGDPIWWCPRNMWFEGGNPGPFYSSNGNVVRSSARRRLDGIRVLVAAGRVTIFPHTIVRGAAAPPPTGPPRTLPRPQLCSAAERVG